jgi:hypothetical protein
LHFKFILFLFVYFLRVINCFKVTFSLSSVHTLKLIVAISIVVTSACTPLLHINFFDLAYNVYATCNVPC